MMMAREPPEWVELTEWEKCLQTPRVQGRRDEVHMGRSWWHPKLPPQSSMNSAPSFPAHPWLTHQAPGFRGSPPSSTPAIWGHCPV